MIDRIKRGIRNPDEVPKFVLKQVLGVRYDLFGWSAAVPNAISKLIHRRILHTSDQTIVWKHDWDLLIILDACRPRWLNKLADQYEWITEISTIQSVGSHSIEWINNTFDESYTSKINDTVYITGNFYSDLAPIQQFDIYENLNRSSYDINSSVPPAHVVTDRTVELTRREDWNRCIVHYMQPHKPIFRTGKTRRDIHLDQQFQPNSTFWRKYIHGNLSESEIEEAFISNLKYVLDEVDILLNNIDATSVVVTSDHGQALGERFLWDHSPGISHDSMRRVPWIETSASDKEELSPGEYAKNNLDDADRQDRLENLGYLI